MGLIWLDRWSKCILFSGMCTIRAECTGLRNFCNQVGRETDPCLHCNHCMIGYNSLRKPVGEGNQEGYGRHCSTLWLQHAMKSDLKIPSHQVESVSMQNSKHKSIWLKCFNLLNNFIVNVWAVLFYIFVDNHDATIWCIEITCYMEWQYHVQYCKE